MLRVTVKAEILPNHFTDKSNLLNLAEKLADYALKIRFDDIPSEAVHEAKRRFIDSIGCALGAFNSDAPMKSRGVVRKLSRSNDCTIIGTSQKTSSDLAAFANGVMIRYLDFNDTYLSKEACHPSDNLSTAIALAESQRKDGRDLITALIVGYEVLCRLCDASNIRDRGWDHVTYGNISTTLVAARLLGLTREQTVNAIALAVTPNNALRQTRVGELSMWKGCAFANAARNGVFASLLASEGVTGPCPIFEGEKGFERIISGELRTNPEQWKGFKILETSIKYYSAEYHSQAAIDAALQLRDEIKIEQIREIKISTFKVAVQIIGGEREKWNPTSRETADHSLPYMVSVALLDGELTPKQFTNQRIQEPQLRSLIRKVRVVSDPKLTKLYPKGIPAIVAIIEQTGEKHCKRVEYPRGHHRNPMTDKEVEEKFRTLTRDRIPGEQMEAFLRKSWNLEKITDFSALMTDLIAT